MSWRNDPVRLVEDPAWSDVLRPIADERMSEARLQENGARIKERIALIVPNGGPHAGGPGAKAASAKAITAAKIALPVITAAAIAFPIAHRALTPATNNPPGESVELNSAEEKIDRDTDRDDEDRATEDRGTNPRAGRQRTHRAHRTRGHARTHRLDETRPEIIDEPRSERAAQAEPAPAAHESEAVPAPATSAAHGESPHSVEPLWPAPPSRKADANPLAEQLALYDQAKDDAKSSKYARALERLDELERRYPDTALKPEIVLSRADYLARAGKRDEAIRFIEGAIADHRVIAKKAQVLRLLGDLWLDRGDCGKATDAFARALKYGLQGAEAQHAQKGIDSCKTR
jgi:tetratricopeptide (TPR) repeat protein